MLQIFEKPVLWKMDSLWLQMGSQVQVVENFSVTHFICAPYNQNPRQIFRTKLYK